MTTQKNQGSIVLAVVIATVVIVGGGIYFWQNAETKQETSLITDCSTLGSSWARFSDNGTSLSFCYKTSWGTPELKETDISPEARIGSVYYISFKKSVSNHPLISYSTLDFQKTGDSDVPPGVSWKELDFNKSETELASLFPSDNVIAQKLLVNGKNVLKLNIEFEADMGFDMEATTRVDYFIPNFAINGTTYNLKIIGSPEQEADLDKLLTSIHSITRAGEVPYDGAVAPSNPISEDPTAPLSFSISDVSASVDVETVPFDNTADPWISMSKKCGNIAESYASRFIDVIKTVYRFTYTGGESQGNKTFTVTILPNQSGYSTLDEFKKDFDQCYDGGEIYPTMLNSNWLLFTHTCKGGFDDGSGNPNGCDEVKKVVLPTLELK